MIEKDDSIINVLEVSGHSNYDTKGKDIVCAGVSAIVVGGLNALLNEERRQIAYYSRACST